MRPLTRAEIPMPVCTNCGEAKPASEFDWRSSGALQSWCRDCNRTHQAMSGRNARRAAHSPIADMVGEMLAADSPSGAIVAAVRAMECLSCDSHAMSRVTSQNVTRDTVTERARLRQAARRKRLKELKELAAAKANDVAASTVTVTRDTCDTSQNRTPLLPSSTSSVEGLIEEGSKKKKTRSENARARGTRMQPGSPLTEEFRQTAISLGASPQVIPEMWAEHVDYWVAVPGERGVKTDWPATWRNDVRRKLKMGTYNGQRPRPHANAGRSGAADFFAGLAAVAEDIDRDGAVAGPADEDIPRGRFEIDGSRAT